MAIGVKFTNFQLSHYSGIFDDFVAAAVSVLTVPLKFIEAVDLSAQSAFLIEPTILLLGKWIICISLILSMSYFDSFLLAVVQWDHQEST